MATGNTSTSATLKKNGVIALLFAAAMAGTALQAQGAGPILLQWGAIDTSSRAAQAESAALKANVAKKAAARARASAAPEERTAYIVQFPAPVTAEWREWLESSTQVRGYLPEFAYLVWATPAEMETIAANPDVFWTGEWKKDYKTVRAVSARAAKGAASATADEARWMQVGSLLAGDAGAADLRARLEARGADVRSAFPRMNGSSAVAFLTDEQIDEVADWPDVEWLEPRLEPRLCNDKAALPNMMNVAPAWEAVSDGGLGLTGRGQVVAVADTGFDLGSLDDVHPDFAGRIVAGYGWLDHAYNPTNSWADDNSHGTHVCGSILGSGALSGGQYRGMAWEAGLVVQGCQENLSGLPGDFGNILSQARDAGARIHSDSWGYGTNIFAGAYVYAALDADAFMWQHQDFLAVIAAGNEGRDADTNGVIDAGCVTPPGTAKNCVCVGAAENYRSEGGRSQLDYGEKWPDYYPAAPIASDKVSSTNSPQGLAAFSGRGPTRDGRLKPDIVAPGTDVISVRSRATTDEAWGVVSANTNYLYMGGTSMATPLTSGALALVRQWLVEQKGMADPPAALMKALLINGARDMTPGQYGTGDTQEITARPDRSQGFGHVNLVNSLEPGDGRFLVFATNRIVATGASFTTNIVVGQANAGTYTLTLAWQDYPGNVEAEKVLVNDLDLTVTSPSGTVYYPNNLATNDRLNNVEFIEFAAAETGPYTVTVNGYNVPETSPHGGQPFALVMRGPKAEAVPGHYAVCVGVNKYKTSYVPADNWLHGCVADATNLRSNLVARGEWTQENATLLLDGAATKAAVRAAITSAAAAAVPGDTFVYTHSSHGYSWPDETGAYTVKTGICTYDGDYEDYDLAADLAKFRSGVKVVVFVDACNSAGLFRGKRGARALSADAAGESLPAGPASTPFDLADRVSAAIDAIRAAEPVRRGIAPRGISSSEIGWLTAADYYQYSWDARDGRVGGEFTLAALDGWHSGLCDDAPCGDEDGYANFYELWNYAKDIAIGYEGMEEEEGESYRTDAQCFNTNVLLSVRAGWIRDAPPPGPDDPPRFRELGDARCDLGETAAVHVCVYASAEAPVTNLYIAAGDPAATLVDGWFSFTSSAVDDYEFTLVAENANGVASNSFTICVYPARPATPTITDVTTNSFNVCWTPSAGAEGYYLSVGKLGRFGWRTYFADDVGNVTNYAFTGLSPNTAYAAYVFAYNGQKRSSDSETTYATTDRMHKAPSWSAVVAPAGQAGRPYLLDLAPFVDGYPAPVLSVAAGDATLDGATLRFTPAAEGTCAFTVAASNDVGTVSTTFEVAVGALAPKKFAVCVGINEYAEISGLTGCVNDARHVAASLIERGGWDAADVAVMLDAAATKAAIRGAISNVAARAVAGDTFIYQHSSHGGQSNAVGEDGKATFLCVYDEDYDDNATAYNDYEIAADLAAFPPGVKVAAIVDACHSGGLFKSREEARAAAASFDLAGRVSAHMDADRARRRARGEDVARTLSASEIGWAVACEYDETSFDGGFFHTDEWLTNPAYGDEYWVEDENGGEYHYPSTYRPGGVFTTSATWAWWNGSADTDPEAGNANGLCDAYEFWKAGSDFCSTVGEFWWENPDDNYSPQCTNVTVLRSIELGRSGASPEPFPGIAPGASAEDIAVRLAGSADASLLEHIRDGATYDAFRAWAGTAKDAAGASAAGLKAVLESPLAWLSFAIGSDRLLELADDALSVASFSLDPATGAFALDVGIDGAAVSDGADPGRLAETFVIYGSESLDGDDASFTPLGVTVESVAPTNGNVRIVADPPAGADAFFLRVLAK